jgi:hypothetical protein
MYVSAVGTSIVEDVMNDPHTLDLTARKGKIALLRETVQFQEPTVIGGLEIEPRLAERMLVVYDALTPHAQELMAMECSADFRSWVVRFATIETISAAGAL